MLYWKPIVLVILAVIDLIQRFSLDKVIEHGIFHDSFHDSRHDNALIQSIHRMFLPISSELFEEYESAAVYSTLDLEPFFRCLLLKPKHAHRLNFN